MPLHIGRDEQPTVALTGFRARAIGMRTLVAVVLAFAGLGCGDPSGPTAIAVDSGSPGPAPCGMGSWTLLETAGACQGCIGFEDSIGLIIGAQTATEGGAVTDTEGNSWQFDSASCTATMGGSCSSIDAIDFDSGVGNRTVICDNDALFAVPGSLPARPVPIAPARANRWRARERRSGPEACHERLRSRHERLLVEPFEVLPRAQGARVGDPIDEERPIQVVELVLKSAGGQTAHLKVQLLATPIPRPHANAGKARHLAAEVRNAETTFEVQASRSSSLRRKRLTRTVKGQLVLR